MMSCMNILTKNFVKFRIGLEKSPECPLRMMKH